MTTPTLRASCGRRPCARSRGWGFRSSTSTTRSARRVNEIDMRFADALSMADHTVTYRLIVKEIAKKAGFHATFMPKPIFGENGSGMHTHQSLFSEGRNAAPRGRRPVASIRQRQGVHRGPALPRARDRGRLRAVDQPGRSASCRVRGPRVRRVVAAQPVGADPDPALQAGLRAGDPRGDPVSRPGVQPVPHVRLPAPRRLRESSRATSRPPDGDELYHLTAEQREARGIVALPETLGGSTRSRTPTSPARRWPALLTAVEPAEGVGRVPRPADTVGARPPPGGANAAAETTSTALAVEPPAWHDATGPAAACGTAAAELTVDREPPG